MRKNINDNLMIDFTAMQKSSCSYCNFNCSYQISNVALYVSGAYQISTTRIAEMNFGQIPEIKINTKPNYDKHTWPSETHKGNVAIM